MALTRECETTMGISCWSQLITEDGQKTEDPYIGYTLEDMRIPECITVGDGETPSTIFMKCLGPAKRVLSIGLQDRELKDRQDDTPVFLRATISS